MQDRQEKLPPRTSGLPIAAVCELEDLRSMGISGPIWRVIMHPNDSNPVHGVPDLGGVTDFTRKKCLFAANGAFPGSIPQRPHDLSGLGDGLRLRLDTGVGLQIIWEKTGAVRPV
jgi:hypothetical protein